MSKTFILSDVGPCTHKGEAQTTIYQDNKMVVKNR